jgi:putative acetyltransferase
VKLVHEATGHEDVIRHIHQTAFGGDSEATIVDTLRRAGRLTCSLVAEVGGDAVGHVVSSAVSLGAEKTVRLEGIGPIAVLPAHQRAGVGAALMNRVISFAHTRPLDALVLLGSPAYYSRFGFAPASTFGLRCKWTDGPAFQVLELRPGSLHASSGEVRYDPCFDGFD